MKQAIIIDCNEFPPIAQEEIQQRLWADRELGNDTYFKWQYFLEDTYPEIGKYLDFLGINYKESIVLIFNSW